MYSWRGLIPYITEDTWRDTGQWHFGKSQRVLACVEYISFIGQHNMVPAVSVETVLGELHLPFLVGYLCHGHI